MDFSEVSGNVFEIYEKYLVPAIFEPWPPKLLDLAHVGEGDRVLDVACGTGVVARLAAQRVGTSGTVVGLDLTPAMLEVARSVPPDSGAPIEWREGDACALPLEDARFDVVLCQAGFMFFPDQPKALREMYRVLAPGGRMGLLVWGTIEHCPGNAVLARALGAHVSAEAAALTRTPFSLGDKAQELRALVEEAGFREVSVRSDVASARFPSPEEFVRLYVAGSPLAPYLAEVDETIQTALISEVDSALQAYVNDEGLEYPVEGHLIVAKK